MLTLNSYKSLFKKMLDVLTDFFTLTKEILNHIEDEGRAQMPPCHFSPVTSRNVGISPDNFLIFFLNPLTTLV